MLYVYRYMQVNLVRPFFNRFTKRQTDSNWFVLGFVNWTTIVTLAGLQPTFYFYSILFCRIQMQKRRMNQHRDQFSVSDRVTKRFSL